MKNGAKAVWIDSCFKKRKNDDRSNIKENEKTSRNLD